MRVSIVALNQPHGLAPWAGIARPYGFGFKREVQPVLDQYCVGCHDGSKPDRPNFKDDSSGYAGFGKSCHALHPFVRKPGPESDIHLLYPMEYHASTSELIQMLEKGHHGVEMDSDAWGRLITWIDLNVPYHATWTEKTGFKPQVVAKAEQLVEHKKIYAALDDDLEWMPPELSQRPNYVEPARKPKQHPPVRSEGWPLGEDAIRSMAGETKVLEVGGLPITFARIPAGRFVMGSISGSPDEAPQAVVDIEKPFWVSVKEITNPQYATFDAEHDSAYIDQQWKDHIYQGYPANKPEMPVIRISWDEAMDYCEWASGQTGLKISLPTEAQWEWAARAGSDQAFWFGQTGFEKHANLADKSRNTIRRSGSQFTCCGTTTFESSVSAGHARKRRPSIMKKIKGKITSIDGRRAISAEEFDRIADSGSDEIDQFIDWTEGKRGGARPGAGRKPKPAARLEVMIRPDPREKLRRKAKEKGVTQVELVESAIEKL